MKATVFTGNRPRHLALVNRLAAVCEEVFAVHECSSAFPGRGRGIFAQSPVLEQYFSHVIQAENEVFGEVGFSRPNVRCLMLQAGELNSVELPRLGESLQSDCIVVFGASYIRSPLVDALVERGAINIHMGVSPYYRGNSSNFWALADGNPDLVGATIHLLSKGLDNGPTLFHVLPTREAVDPFVFGMRAVEAAHGALVRAVTDGTLRQLTPVPQDRSQEIRYSRSADFTDEVATRYLQTMMSPQSLARALASAPTRALVRPSIS